LFKFSFILRERFSKYSISAWKFFLKLFDSSLQDSAEKCANNLIETPYMWWVTVLLLFSIPCLCHLLLAVWLQWCRSPSLYFSEFIELLVFICLFLSSRLESFQLIFLWNSSLSVSLLSFCSSHNVADGFP
jgi:hypothetical protein